MDQSTLVPDELRALSPGDFSFFGLDGHQRKIANELRRVHLRGSEPEVSTVDGAVYLPEELSGRMSARRGELGHSLPHSSPLVYEREVDEEVVYLGWLFNHYGHFLMQSLARTWVLPQVDSSSKVLFHHPSLTRWQPKGWALRMLENFGVPPERILTLNVPTRVHRMIVPEPLFEPRGIAEDHTVRAHQAMARPYQAVAERIAGDVRPSSQPVYLSRRLLPPSQRTIVGEDDLEAVLCENGFRIAYTETMSFEEQVRLVNEHADIFSNAGSAAHNVLLSLHGPRLHLLTHAFRFSPDYYLYARVSGAPTTFINCLNTAGRKRYTQAHKQTPHLLDIPTIVAYLDQQGFLTKPMPVSLAGSTAERQTRYEEAWLYGYLRALHLRDALPLEIEQEAQRVASSSWPVSLVLAWHYVRRNAPHADSVARQFADLAATETDTNRLARYRSEVAEMASTLATRCSRNTATRLADVAIDRFQVALRSKERLP
jgi:capsular polysaccharide biosynthesis protein